MDKTNDGGRSSAAPNECFDVCYAKGSRSSPSIFAILARKVAALPGVEAVAEVTFPPLIGLVEMTDLYFVGLRMLGKPVAKSEVAVEPHEFAKINIGDARVAPNDQHVLVIICSRRFTKVCRTGNHQRVGPQRIHQHVFRMQVSDVNVQSRE